MLKEQIINILEMHSGKLRFTILWLTLIPMYKPMGIPQATVRKAVRELESEGILVYRRSSYLGWVYSLK